MEDPMLTLDLVPHLGVGPILLGSARAEARVVLLALGFPLEPGGDSVDHFCQSAIQIEYGPDDRVSFIGLSCHERFTVSYQDRSVFALSAPDVFALMAASERSASHTYQEYEYCFPDQIITLWNADEQYDRLGGESRPVWAQVGLGDKTYLAAIAAIRGKA